MNRNKTFRTLSVGALLVSVFLLLALTGTDGVPDNSKDDQVTNISSSSPGVDGPPPQASPPEQIRDSIDQEEPVDTVTETVGQTDSGQILPPTPEQPQHPAAPQQLSDSVETVEPSHVVLDSSLGASDTEQQPVASTEAVTQSISIDQSSESIESNQAENADTRGDEPVPDTLTLTGAEPESQAGTQPPESDAVKEPGDSADETVVLETGGAQVQEGHEGEGQEGEGQVEEKAGEGEKTDEGLTFSEWAERVRAAEEKDKQDEDSEIVVVPTKQQKRRKNYAQRDCGAKILASNPEATKVAGILDSNKDDYMINPCSVKKWFVVELCEPIQAQTIEIASLELFSSQPKSFRLFLSDRFPTKDWKAAGLYQLSDERSVQQFPVTEASEYFAKYARVELLEHYGEEHFCALTLIRINGMAVVDYDDREEDEDNDMDTDEVPAEEEAESEDGNLFTRTKNTVMKIVKTVLNVDDLTAEGAEETGGPELRVNETVAEGNATVGNSTDTAANDNKTLPDLGNRTQNVSDLPCEADTGGENGDKSSKLPSDGSRSEPTKRGEEASPDLKQGETDPVLVVKIEDDEQVPSEQDEPLVTLIESEEPADTGHYHRFSHCFSCAVQGPGTAGSCSLSPHCRYGQLLLERQLGQSCLSATPTPSQTLGQPSVTTADTSRVLETGSPAVNSTAASTTQESEADIQSAAVTMETSSVTEQRSSQQEVETADTLLQPTQTVGAVGESASQSASTNSPQGQVTPTPSSVLHTASASSTLSHQEVGANGQVSSDNGAVSGSSLTPSSVKSADQELEPSPSGMPGTLPDVTSASQSGEATPSLATVTTDKADAVEVKPSEAGTEKSMDMTAGESIVSATQPLPEHSEASSAVAMETNDASVEMSQPELPDSTGVEASDQSGAGNTTADDSTVSQEIKPVEDNSTAPLDSKADKDLGLVKVPVNIPFNKRETAIMRLSNRIKVLEQNVSLSSRFLEELSRRYKKQSEDMMKMLNRTVAKLNNVTAAADVKDQQQTDQISVLEARLENLTSVVSQLTNSLHSVNQQVTDRQMIWTTIEIIILCVMLVLLYRRGHPPPLTPEMKAMIDAMPSKPVPPSAKRRNSISGPATPSKTRIDIEAAPILQKCNSDPSLADSPVIEPGLNLFIASSQPREGHKKKKKKKHKHLESRSSAGLTKGEAADGTRLSSSAGLLFETASEQSGGTSPVAASSASETSVGNVNLLSASSSGASVSSLPSDMSSRARNQAIARKPVKPPSPAVNTKTPKLSPNMGTWKGHKRVGSLPKHVEELPPFKTGHTEQPPVIKKSRVDTETLQQLSVGNHGNTQKTSLCPTRTGARVKKCASGNLTGNTCHGVQKSQVETVAGATAEVVKSKYPVPQYDVAPLCYSVTDKPYSRHSNETMFRSKGENLCALPTHNGQYYADDDDDYDFNENSASPAGPQQNGVGISNPGGWRKLVAIFK